MVRKANEISSKILEIKGEKFGEPILQLVLKYANEYIDSFKAIASKNYPTPLNIMDDVKKLNSNPFYEWINNEPGFIEAKRILIDKKIIYEKLDDINLDLQEAYIKQYQLEYFCANIISLALCIPNLKDVIVVPRKWKKLVSVCEIELVQMCRNFELEAEEQLFIWLIGRLKKSKGSIINSGKTHQAQLREFMIKRLIQAIYQLSNGKKMSSNAVVNASLGISGIFFEQMSRSDAAKHSKKILVYVERTNHFMQQKVIDVLLSKG